MALLCSVDYDGMELKSWAQVCLWTVGHSRMAQVLNSGLDPHTELGASLKGITKPEAYALLKAGGPLAKAFKDAERQTGKIGNFGFQGGMGPATLRTQARKEYKVHMTLPQAVNLRDKWKLEWPESVDYFAWVNSQLHGPRDQMRGTAVHFLSQRVRANIPYTVFCNTLFQGLTADAAKAAGFRLAYECYADTSSPLYGCRIVDFIHDEYLLEVHEEPELAHLAAYRQRDIMVEEAQRYHPDIRVTAEPALMRRWSKNAKTVHRGGLLIPYEDAA